MCHKSNSLFKFAYRFEVVSMTTEFNDILSSSLSDESEDETKTKTRVRTRVKFCLRMWGLPRSAQGYLCGLISDTPFHTEYASFLQQSMGHRKAVKSARCEHDPLSPRQHVWMILSSTTS